MAGGAVAVLAVAAFGALALMPVGWLRAAAEQRLSARVGRPVTIGAIERETRLSLSPVLRIRDIRVPQAAWTDGGDLARVRLVRVRLPLLPLLVGRAAPEPLTVSGARLDLVRAADGRVNWRAGPEEKAARGAGPSLAGITVDDAVIRYRDAKQRRSAVLAVRISPEAGLTATGRGTVDGHPVSIRAQGAPLKRAGPWPFVATLAGPALSGRVEGRMAGPFRMDDMQMRVEARAADLKLLDRVIEAGLFRTQPIALTANVRHRDDVWTIGSLAGTVGRSRLAGGLTVDKRAPRTRIDGKLRFAALDFDDLASDAALARARALERRIGRKLVPNTKVSLAKLGKVDGTLDVRVDRILSRRGPSALRTIAATLRLDQQRLTVEPLRIGLARGALSGRIIVDQREGAPRPRVDVALDLDGGTVGTLLGMDEVEARLDGHVRLSGSGDRLREAMGRADGRIGLATDRGQLPARMASLLGLDIGRGLTIDPDKRATLRCGAVRLRVRGGRGTIESLIVDTSRSQLGGTGTLTLPAETISATLTGRPKQKSVLRLDTPLLVSGTIRDPALGLPEGARSTGSVVRALGKALGGGGAAPLAADADCASVRAGALR